MTLSENVPAESVSQAALLRQKGNDLFTKGLYSEALTNYLECIRLESTSSVYFSNAAACYLRLEDWENAQEMASEALARDPSTTKAYYRRGCARLKLGDFRMALGDLKTVLRVSPNDPDAKKLSQECEKAIIRDGFMKAIRVSRFELRQESIDELEVDATYAGPVIRKDGISRDEMLSLMDWFVKERKLPAKYTFQLLLHAMNAFKKDDVLHEISNRLSKITVCGDTHGQYFDIYNLFKNVNGYPSEEHGYLFNGDYVDRGSMSVEVFLTLCGWKSVYPQHFWLSRGNHEVDSINRFRGFHQEITKKYGSCFEDVFGAMNKVMNWLPICYTVYGQYFVTHGGIPRGDLSLSEIKQVKRSCVHPNGSLACNLMWCDPQSEPGLAPSHRGEGFLFGPDVTRDFLQRNSLSKIIRSHVWEPTGFKIEHDEKCITIFSAPNYIPGTPSPAAYIDIDRDGNLSFHQFEAWKP